MPIPGLTDVYEFSTWLKTNYIGTGRKQLLITPIQGGLINVATPDMPYKIIESQIEILPKEREANGKEEVSQAQGQSDAAQEQGKDCSST